MVDHLSARLDKAVGKIERMSQQASSANRQIRELDRSGSLLNNTVGKLAAAFTIKELVSNITRYAASSSSWRCRFRPCSAVRRRPTP